MRLCPEPGGGGRISPESPVHSAPLARLGAVAREMAALAAVEALQPAALGRGAGAREVALLVAVEARGCALGVRARARHVPSLAAVVARYGDLGR